MNEKNIITNPIEFANQIGQQLIRIEASLFALSSLVVEIKAQMSGEDRNKIRDRLAEMAEECRISISATLADKTQQGSSGA